MKKQEFRKMRRLRNLWDNFKYSNIHIIGMSEGEEQKQEVENLFEQIMKENLAKKIRLPERPGSSESKQVGPKEAHTKAHHNCITQDER